MSRIICWFSCGAASAVATKLAIAENDGQLPLTIAYTEVAEEHPDNKRFLSDCEKWFGVPITILKNEKYNGSIYEVFRKERFLVGPSGAACTRLLKKEVRKKFEQPGDIQVFGYTVEELHRVDRFIDANNEVRLSTPLIERGLTKQDCLAMLERAGIGLPMMYLLGYKNNNCIGCVKGGAGYWNKIRQDFPAQFERMSQMEESLGRTICKTNGKRIFLRQLPPDAGRYESESSVECGIFCELAEQEVTA
ncbi:hypothetical protein [Saezia sanguinis]|uniref:hypothetical protein n=1 Tax=Saezia sanguinis TaxID=1965230 RepID=UPI00307291C8